MKYIIDVDKDRVSKHGKLELLCEVENALPQYIHTAIDARPYTEPDRKAIEDEVWEFSSRLMTMHPDVAEDIYWSMNGGKGIGVAAEMSYQEAKAKYEAWLKQKDEIRVGDEVGSGFVKGTAFFVDGTMVEGFFIDDNEEIEHFWWNKRDCKKTGRHFDEVEELLKKMRGEEQ